MEFSRVQDYDYDSELKYLSAEWNNNNNNNNNKPHRISRHNTMSRRFLPSSNFPITSSTASSPGYTFKDEIIDPSTYCFSTAIKALQAKSAYHTCECSSSPSDQVGLALNSKWNEAEKYICNPLSGKVPLECLSAKSLSGRSFRHLSSSSSNRITMSAPLIFTSSSKPFSSSSNTTTSHSQQDLISMQLPINLPEKKEEEGRTRDVGTQSTPPYLSSSSPSPASTPSIIERSIKRFGESSPVSNSKTKSEYDEVEEEKIEKEREETIKTVTVATTHHGDEKEEQVYSSSRRSGCFSWTRFLRNHHHHHHHKTAKPTKYHFKPC